MSKKCDIVLNAIYLLEISLTCVYNCHSTYPINTNLPPPRPPPNFLKFISENFLNYNTINICLYLSKHLLRNLEGEERNTLHHPPVCLPIFLSRYMNLDWFSLNKRTKAFIGESGNWKRRKGKVFQNGTWFKESLDVFKPIYYWKFDCETLTNHSTFPISL